MKVWIKEEWINKITILVAIMFIISAIILAFRNYTNMASIVLALAITALVVSCTTLGITLGLSGKIKPEWVDKRLISKPAIKKVEI